MDMTESIAPRSDQINADDLVGGPITYTIREVVQGKAEQPFDFLLVETNRAYRPSKTMRRVIVNAWGKESADYAGRRLTVYREPSITFGREKVGGIRISHMSHIDGPREVMVQTTRGKRERFVVDPLSEAAPAPKADAMTNAQSKELGAAFEAAGVQRDARLDYCRNLIGRDLNSPGDLTQSEAAQIIEALTSDAEK